MYIDIPQLSTFIRTVFFPYKLVKVSRILVFCFINDFYCMWNFNVRQYILYTIQGVPPLENVFLVFC